jgi:hypothetical protein
MKTVKLWWRVKRARTYGLNTLLTCHFTGQFDSIASRYSAGFMASFNLLGYKRLRGRDKDDFSGREPTVI